MNETRTLWRRMATLVLASCLTVAVSAEDAADAMSADGALEPSPATDAPPVVTTTQGNLDRNAASG